MAAWFFLPLALFLFTRVVLLFALVRLTHYSEFTEDIRVFDLALKPLSVITFSTDISAFSQPPLFPLILAPLAIPLVALFGNVGSRFLASRVSFSLFELLAFLILAQFLSREIHSPHKKRAALTIVALSPLGFMTGTVMRQEEAIVAVFIASILLAVSKGSKKWASILTAAGVLAAKVFVGLVFVPLLLTAKSKDDVRAILRWGILPLAVFLLAYGSVGYARTGVVPLFDFAPSDTTFCASPFTILQYFQPINGPAVKWVSLSLVMIALLLLWSFLPRLHDRDFPAVTLAVFCILFLFFYHINTEYHIFILPLLGAVPYLEGFSLPRYTINLSHLMLAISTWGFGVVYGVRRFVEGRSYVSESKEWVRESYDRFFWYVPLKPAEILFLVLTLVSIALILAVAYRSIKGSRNSREGCAPDPAHST